LKNGLPTKRLASTAAYTSLAFSILSPPSA
jgi:hypothetical protein